MLHGGGQENKKQEIRWVITILLFFIVEYFSCYVFISQIKFWVHFCSINSLGTFWGRDTKCRVEFHSQLIYVCGSFSMFHVHPKFSCTQKISETDDQALKN